MQAAKKALSEVRRVVSGSNTCESSVSYDLDSQSWKTVEDSSREDSTLSSEDFHRSGMIVSGCLYALPTLARLNAVKVVASSRLHAQGSQWHDADRRCGFPPRRGDTDAWQAYTDNGCPQPGILRGPDGVFEGLDKRRLAVLGNSVVPQCAEVMGWVIQGLIREY
ncbi:MAG: hypothetical protein WC565_04740 [Parcubacteria group bacterium]